MESKKTSRDQAAPAAPGREKWTPAQWFLVIAFLWFSVVVLRTAWQSDDAFISFRTALVFWSGQGLGWNPGERVQTYTNPLWMMVSLVCQGLFDEVYFSTLVVSIVMAMTAVWMIGWRLSRTPQLSLLLVGLLSVSAAVVDYATSGLENALLGLLLVLFTVQLRQDESARRCTLLGLLAAAVALTRLDAFLMVLPSLAWTAWQGRPRPKVLRHLALGLVPLAAWELFSLVYYGSLVPNTAYAKLNLDLSKLTLAEQGLTYFADSLLTDPVTLLLMLVAIFVTFRKGAMPERLFALGICLYCLYVVRIGGDYMSGRFLAAPAVAAAALLAWRCDESVSAHPLVKGRYYVYPAAIAAILVYGVSWPASPWSSGVDYGKGKTLEDIVRPSGIADERAYYYPTTGLLMVLRQRSVIEAQGLPTPPYRGAVNGLKFSQEPNRVVLTDEAGFFGYFAGPDKFILDIWALGDPLLARLPYQPEENWRVGHFPRRMPAGYRKTIAEGSDHLVDPELSKLYRAIQIVIRGPLFTSARWREIWRLNTGYYNEITRRSDYR